MESDGDNAQIQQPSQLPNERSIDMDDYDDEQEKEEMDPGLDMGEGEANEDILDGYGMEDP